MVLGLQKRLMVSIIFIISLYISEGVCQDRNEAKNQRILGIIKQVNTNIEPVLTRNQRRILSSINIEFNNSPDAKSLARAELKAKKKVITFGQAFIIKIMHSAVAQLIDQVPEFERARFFPLYIAFYDYFGFDKVTPDKVAVLSTDELPYFQQLLFDDNFAYIIYDNIRFVYLHELSHHLLKKQLKVRAKVIDKLAKLMSDEVSNRKKIKQLYGQLREMEFEADRFAFEILYNFHNKYQYENIQYLRGSLENVRVPILLFELRDEDRSFVAKVAPSDIERDLRLYEFMKSKFCSTNKEYCQYLEGRISEYRKLINDNDQANKRMINEPLLYKKDLYLLYHMGDGYLRGIYGLSQKPDSALYYYEYGAVTGNYPDPSSHNWYGMDNEKSFNETVEYCQLISALLYEYVKKDKTKAIDLYQNALKGCYFMSKDFYQSKITSLNQ